MTLIQTWVINSEKYTQAKLGRITKSTHGRSQKGRQVRRARKEGQQRGANTKRWLTGMHQSPVKHAESEWHVFTSSVFFPSYSNCSMGENRKSFPLHRGWICAFLFPSAIPPDRQENSCFQAFLQRMCFVHAKACPPCSTWWGKCRSEGKMGNILNYDTGQFWFSFWTWNFSLLPVGEQMCCLLGQ